MNSRFALVVLALAAPFAQAALADPLDARAARPMLFRDDRVEVIEIDVSGLTEAERTALTTVAQTQKYYAAVGFAPDVGIMAEPTVMASNYHSPEAARAAALAGCDARRHGGRACVIALEVRPQGWEARDLSLSADATTAFNDDYRRAGGTRAFAVSAGSGQWGIGRGNNAVEDALTACQGDGDVSDCAIVIQD
ncbi:MAG TPA: 5-aminolevulic acid synthase [Pararhodobacter sp.]|uniref:5-aminolevulic acid synthase n=1 Tax=Pararhodobacter sp. TaxID=2127056 RepID=UPI002D187689|nr:5-aminolevulic acid synthase [Pararhodobacter sp.]HPD92321.1 5-aminolevulic acid synthase [Pararhodobacter sp.]